MGVKEECKLVLNAVFGPATAAKVDSFPDSPKECIDLTEDLMGKFIGSTKAKEKMVQLREKYHV